MSGSAQVQFNLPFSFGIGDTPPMGIDPKLKPMLDEIYNAFKQAQLAMHNYMGVGQQLKTLWPNLSYLQTLHQFSATRYYAQASEALIYGAAINLFDSAGKLWVRNANATNNTKPCHGFCTTLGGVLINDYCESILNRGVLTGFVGLTRGSRYFLSTVNGLITAAAPVAAGNNEQALGLAVDTTALLFDFSFHFIQH